MSQARFLIFHAGLLLSLGLLFQPMSLNAQSPVGEPLLTQPVDGNVHDWHSQTILANGDLLVVWRDYTELSDTAPMWFRGRRFGLHRKPSEMLTLVQKTFETGNPRNELVAPRTDGGFLLTFMEDGPVLNSYGCHSIAFDTDGAPLASEAEFAPQGGCGGGLVALADGTFATTWQVGDPAFQPRDYRMFGRLSPLGELISRPRRINPAPRRADSSFGYLAGNANGDMTLMWGNAPTQVRFFNAYGGPLPPLTFVGFTDSNAPSAAVLPNGGRIFAGLMRPPGDVNYVAYQRFSRDGAPLGPLRRAHSFQHALFGDPVIAADRLGNFVIAWGSLPGTFCDRLQARLFRSDGTPVGKEFFPDPEERCEWRPQASFAADGTFALSWVDSSGVNVAWFSASPADEPCLARGGRLLCDTGRTGGLPEIDQPDAPAAFDTLFLADFDGDGRADPCYHSGVTFACDLEHRGREPRARVDFGISTDRPLLGDVDGDGRADACVRRGDLLACDTAHDGGSAEFEEHFGNPADIPLLGDLDGDGRADLCLFHEGVFSCDVAHKGGAPDLVIAFGRAGDLPVLGDFDGDGRADPCVLRGQTLRCDTRHDGGRAEAALKLVVRPGDGIVMGNLDGL